MRIKLLKLILSVFIVSSICSVDKVSYADQGDVYPDESVLLDESIGDDRLKCLRSLAKTTIDMLIATRGVIAKNQELINRDPISGNYYFKGFVPAVVGSQVANDFSLITGHNLKQTSLKLRNATNAPDEWEREVLKILRSPIRTGRTARAGKEEKVLKLLESSEYAKDVGFGEILEIDGKKVYRYMKPIYIERACLDCHGVKENIRPAIRQFLERRYPHDEAYDYKEGDFRGGISITISLERLGF